MCAEQDPSLVVLSLLISASGLFSCLMQVVCVYAGFLISLPFHLPLSFVISMVHSDDSEQVLLLLKILNPIGKVPLICNTAETQALGMEVGHCFAAILRFWASG